MSNINVDLQTKKFDGQSNSQNISQNLVQTPVRSGQNEHISSPQHMFNQQFMNAFNLNSSQIQSSKLNYNQSTNESELNPSNQPVYFPIQQPIKQNPYFNCSIMSQNQQFSAFSTPNQYHTSFNDLQKGQDQFIDTHSFQLESQLSQNQMYSLHQTNQNFIKNDHGNPQNPMKGPRNIRSDMNSPQQLPSLGKSQSEFVGQYKQNYSSSSWQSVIENPQGMNNNQIKQQHQYYNFIPLDVISDFKQDLKIEQQNIQISFQSQQNNPTGTSTNDNHNYFINNQNSNINNNIISQGNNNSIQTANNNNKKNSNNNTQIQQNLQSQSIIDQRKLKITDFKVHACTKRDKHEKKKCPYYHNEGDRRRCPEKHKYSFNECKKKDKCHLKEDCPQVHNKVEQLYHPLRYKAKFCESYKENNQKCEYGNFCSFAHNESEIVIPMICKLKRDTIFYMYFYKTVWCPNTQKHERSLCPYMHNVQDFRRDPKSFHLEPRQCDQWKKTNISKYSEGECPQQLKCNNCHGWKEHDYHPQVYKTKPCNIENCPQNLECVLYHSDEDKRTITTLLLQQEEEQAMDRLKSLMKQETVCSQDVKLGAPIDVFYNETEEKMNIIGNNQNSNNNQNIYGNNNASGNNNMMNQNAYNPQKNRLKSQTLNNQQHQYQNNRQQSNSQSGSSMNQYNYNHNNKYQNSGHSHNQRNQDQNRNQNNQGGTYNNNKQGKNNYNFVYQAVNQNNNNNNSNNNNNIGHNNNNNQNNFGNKQFNNYQNQHVPVNIVQNNQNISLPANNNNNRDIQDKKQGGNNIGINPNSFNNYQFQNNYNNFNTFGPMQINNFDHNEQKSAYSSNTEQTVSNYTKSRGSSIGKGDFDVKTIINQGNTNPLIISPNDIRVPQLISYPSYSSSQVNKDQSLSKKNNCSEIQKYFEKKQSSEVYDLLLQNKYNDDMIVKLNITDIPSLHFLVESQKINLRSILIEIDDEKKALDLQQLCKTHFKLNLLLQNLFSILKYFFYQIVEKF